MKVRLAAQTLRSSVAVAQQFLRDEKIKEFEYCMATVEYIRAIDPLFDFLNSKNPYGKGFKEPLRDLKT